MSKPNLTLCSLNYHNAEYFHFQEKICRELANNDFQRIILETSEAPEYEELNKLTNTKIINGSFVNQFYGSYAHGVGLNELFKYLDSEYTIILDPDVVPLQKNWDLTILESLKEFDLVGIPYNPLHGRRRIQGIPTAFFMAFETEKLTKLDLDWRSGRQWYRVTLYKILGRMGHPKIYDFEASHKALRKILHSDLKWHAFEMVQPWEKRSRLKFDISYLSKGKTKIDPLRHIYPEEWWFDGKPFVTHQRRSIKKSFNRNEYSKDWVKNIDSYLSKF